MLFVCVQRAEDIACLYLSGSNLLLHLINGIFRMGLFYHMQFFNICLKSECAQVVVGGSMCFTFVSPIWTRKGVKNCVYVRWYSGVSNWFVFVMGELEPNLLHCFALACNFLLLKTFSWALQLCNKYFLYLLLKMWWIL